VSKKLEEDTISNDSGINPFIIEADTWKRDSHGLFDYETGDSIKNLLKIEGTTKLLRMDNGIEQDSHPKDRKRKADVILDVSFGSQNNIVTNKDEIEEEKFS